jgi:hypothetical protein
MYFLLGEAQESLKNPQAGNPANELRFRPKYSWTQNRDATHSTLMFGFKEAGYFKGYFEIKSLWYRYLALLYE